jgi:hypothetical protein
MSDLSSMSKARRCWMSYLTSMSKAWYTWILAVIWRHTWAVSRLSAGSCLWTYNWYKLVSYSKLYCYTDTRNARSHFSFFLRTFEPNLISWGTFEKVKFGIRGWTLNTFSRYGLIRSFSNSISIPRGLKAFMLKNCKVHDFLGNSEVAFFIHPACIPANYIFFPSSPTRVHQLPECLTFSVQLGFVTE